MRELLNRRRRRIVVLATAVPVLLIGTGMNGTASASDVGCGSVVTSSVTLHEDIGPCPADGLVIAADGVTVDLNGFRIFGTSGPTAAADAGVGVVVNGASSVVVKNGSVTDFDSGVAILNGADNEVSGLAIRNNIPSDLASGDFGDGIQIQGATADNNRLLNNTIANNGPFAGISIFAGVSTDKLTGTVIDGNTVKDNKVSSQTGGIRLENWTWNSTISNNTVTGNALEGVALFADTQFNTVVGNTINDNGFTSETAIHRKGDGIRAFQRTASNTVQDNEVFGNAGNGILISGPLTNRSGVTVAVGSTLNQILTNQTGANSAAPTVLVDEGGVVIRLRVHTKTTVDDQTLILPPPSATFDLHDGNANCDSNTWSGNTFKTANPVCTTT